MKEVIESLEAAIESKEEDKAAGDREEGKEEKFKRARSDEIKES